MSKNKKPVFGVGINDADYVVQSYAKRVFILCPFYKKWISMLQRCYSERFQKNQPNYNGCTVCDEWLTFSKFKVWMEKQDWKGKQLDKDLLFVGNKIYSPETCALVTSKTNQFVKDSKANRGEFMIGVSYSKRAKKFIASCGNPFSTKRENLGYFTDEHSAHLAWRMKKHEFACMLADIETDDRVVVALKARYLGDIA
jgi:hypothetical protein